MYGERLGDGVEYHLMKPVIVHTQSHHWVCTGLFYEYISRFCVALGLFCLNIDLLVYVQVYFVYAWISCV